MSTKDRIVSVALWLLSASAFCMIGAAALVVPAPRIAEWPISVSLLLLMMAIGMMFIRAAMEIRWTTA